MYQPQQQPQQQHRPHAAEEHASSSGDEAGCCGQETQSHLPYKGPISAAPGYIRSDFIRKVYSILAAQLLLTVAIGAPLCVYGSPQWAAEHIGLYYLASFTLLATVVGMACCCGKAIRTYPTNYIILLVITVTEAVVVGFMTMLYTGPSVIMAVAATALVFGSLTTYACLTKTDFTGCGPYLFCALSAMCCFGFVVMICSFFFPLPPAVRLVYALCGVVLFSCYIVYDTQLIVGGAHKAHQFDVDDYCFAALNVYMDIINLFIYLLELFGDRR